MSAPASPRTVSAAPDVPGLIRGATAALVFLAFALGYFSSAVLRAITATLSPVLTAEFDLRAGELGLLAGGFFLGFASTQLPLGTWLDRHGPKRVALGFMGLAVLACLAFAWASSFGGLLLARVLMGMGLSACLMAPLTGFRRWYEPAHMLRANSWMLMSGSLGMVTSTLPVQWLLPVTGWRPLFWFMAAFVVLTMVLIARWVPAWPAPRAGAGQGGYGPIVRSRTFLRVVPMALFNYGGMVGLQTLWAGPWLTRVTGLSASDAAQGLFFLNLSMLAAFMAWGWITPGLFRRGWSVDRLMLWGMPLSLGLLVFNIAAGSATGWVGWAAYCVACTVMALAQPALGMKYPAALAGRVLSAYNLVVFVGIFAMQWGVGLLIDLGLSLGWSEVGSFQASFAVYALACGIGYLVFALNKDNPGS